MGYNLAYKSLYNDRVRQHLERYGPQNLWEPDTNFSKPIRRGGTNERWSTHPYKNESNYLKPSEYEDKKVYRSGNSYGYSMYNRNLLDEINKMKVPYKFLQGASRPYIPIEKDNYDYSNGPIKERILKTLSPKEKEIQGGVSKKILKKAVSKGLDAGFDLLPLTVGTIGLETGPLDLPLELATNAISQKARKEVKKKTGYGGVVKYTPQEGGISFKDVKKVTKKGVQIATPIAKKLVKKGISKGFDLTLDQGIGEIAKLAAPKIGLPSKQSEQVAKALGKEVRKEVKKKTGFGAKKKVNPWIEHLKEYSKKHDISYRDALKCPKAKAAYRNK